MTRAAGRAFSLYAIYGISVEGVIDTTVREACRGERIAGYRRLRLSTFGRVRRAGSAPRPGVRPGSAFWHDDLAPWAGCVR